MDDKKGGKYVGKGTYGCVFSPAVQCLNHSNRKRNRTFYAKSVGKVFTDIQEYKNEKDNYHDTVKKLDPDHLFTVNMREGCQIGELSKADRTNPCQGLRPRLPQLVYTDGGPSLRMWASKNKGNVAAFIKFFKHLNPVLTGLTQMIHKNYVHHDIKLDNILYNNTKVSLIDFGLMTSVNTLYNEDDKAFLSADYWIWPVEHKAYRATTGQQVSASALDAYLDDTLTSNAPFKNWRQWFSFFGVHVKVSLQELSRLLTDARNTDNTQLYIEFARKTDIYSLGISLLELYILMHMDEAVEKRSATMQMKIMLIRDFIRCLIEPNPMRRYSSMLALKHHDKLVKLFRSK